MPYYREDMPQEPPDDYGWLDECIHDENDTEYMDCQYCEHDGECHVQRKQQREEYQEYEIDKAQEQEAWRREQAAREMWF